MYYFSVIFVVLMHWNRFLVKMIPIGKLGICVYLTLVLFYSYLRPEDFHAVSLYGAEPEMLLSYGMQVCFERKPTF